MISARLMQRCMQCGGVVKQMSLISRPHTPLLSSTRNLASRSGRGKKNGNPFVNYLRSLKWVPIPVGVGFAYIGYQQFGHVVKREERFIQNSTSAEDLVATDWVVKLYKCLPLKMLSRVWGRVSSAELPLWMREPLYKAYIWAFNCNMDEAAIRDLQHYRNLGEFFKRRLRPGVRPIDSTHNVICPSDGVVLHYGRSAGGHIEQVKGVSYSLQDFLGPPNWPHHAKKAPVMPKQPIKEVKDKDTIVLEPLPSKMGHPAFEKAVKNNEETALYHCVIYLAPGDYHGFHSPANWTITQRRHFPGELFSVNPGIARLVKGLFSLNERAVYMGEWQHGFFSMTAVGATNVGSIRMFFDKDLETNQPYRYAHGSYFDFVFQNEDMEGIPIKKGESFGEFNLGSTIVLLFEAPTDFEFRIEPGQKVKVGEPLGHCNSKPVIESGA